MPLTITTSLRYSNGDDFVSQSQFSDSSTPSSAARTELNISIGTVDETVALGDVASIGEILIQNLDATNFITVGPDGSSYPIKIMPGRHARCQWNGAAIHLKADTAACRARVMVFSA